jgi:very-short-patch-repair endonuclease
MPRPGPPAFATADAAAAAAAAADAAVDAAADFAYYSPRAPIIALLARKGHGVVSRDALLHAGVAAHRIDARVRSGRLRVVHRGVYEVRGMATAYTPLAAALLACGGRAAVAGASAALLWRLPGGTAPAGVEVVVENAHRRRPGIIAHRVRAIVEGELTLHHGIRVTTPARTLLDLAPRLSARALEQAIALAEHAEVMTRSDLVALLERRAGHRGSRAVRAVLCSDAPLAMTRSPAEELVLRHLRSTSLPQPEPNAALLGLEVDFLWRQQRFVLEVDGYRYHRSARGYHTDRRRDAVLIAHGYRVMRITWKQITEEPVATMVSLAQGLLGAPDRGGRDS